MATRCLAIASAGTPLSASQWRALAALVSVSCVVKVLLETMNRVRLASSPRSTLHRAQASGLET